MQQLQSFCSASFFSCAAQAADALADQTEVADAGHQHPQGDNQVRNIQGHG